MSNENVELVRRAFDACRRGDAATLREVFAYDNEVQIIGATDCPAPYPPLHDPGFDYKSVSPKGDNKVESEIEYRRDPKRYRGTLTDTIGTVGGERKIVSSTVVWGTETQPYPGPTYDDYAEYEATYGWWGWPIGRRRR
ncbi:hypothetical protein GBA65_09230 [Rubrobacter marinus]|uniref:SnoaL-like domain-containing protein n=1 Tax=Rubrobacter marinus TaxID=2653852 RepID=A0A6G8PWU6_9ACTN|nr:hypothetical protein [Rubrobacter marinus]QIN78670.1 hypothetical protein GBA65_09230 [Rubrobacter marinus]